MYFGFNPRKGKLKRDILLIVLTLVVVIALVVSIIPAIYGINATQNHRIFVDEYTTSLNHARKNGGLRATQGNETWRVSNDFGSMIYTQIVDAGMGKPQKEAPASEEFTVFAFPDGSELMLCQTEIMEKSRIQDQGVYIAFTNKEGKIFQYDTDRIDVEKFFNIIENSKR